ncbi:hypothetical protein [Streptomyces chattanoogensis]|uniref:Ig-like domain-containing protein n=1 Tax=Streptomyces chattanoogensis TaxID=66876 RepID=A0A0N0XTC5_9ACTN|nr:hypothetical protein [Streptomyces chattanoogensis]KPC61536.1 hypothetical protein ADL29_23875 [Streptomyces chattanoogensis]
MTITRSRFLGAGAALALACGALLLPVPAHAAPKLLSCTGTQTVTYKPPLTDTPKSTKVTITEVYTSCVNVDGIRSGTGSFSLTETASCTSINNPLGAQDSPTYTWNTGDTSGVLFKVTSVDRLANGTTQVTAVGKVTNGYGQGNTATRTVTLPTLNATACRAGVPQQSGPATLTFV